MRNGNLELLKEQDKAYYVLILPMRNGNLHLNVYTWIRGFYRSYPTYEEWKHSFVNFDFLGIYGSYPTYEEWKPNIFKFLLISPISSSYPTYEEWKP